MKNMWKRYLAFVMAMVLQTTTMAVYAEEREDTVQDGIAVSGLEEYSDDGRNITDSNQKE